MEGEINRDWYCSARHRKWPTPEQFKEEYGEEYPEDGAVYTRLRNLEISEDYRIKSWLPDRLRHARHLNKLSNPNSRVIQIVCACSPWGKPPNDWRPE